MQKRFWLRDRLVLVNYRFDCLGLGIGLHLASRLC